MDITRGGMISGADARAAKTTYSGDRAAVDIDVSGFGIIHFRAGIAFAADARAVSAARNGERRTGKTVNIDRRACFDFDTGGNLVGVAGKHVFAFKNKVYNRVAAYFDCRTVIAVGIVLRDTADFYGLVFIKDQRLSRPIVGIVDNVRRGHARIEPRSKRGYRHTQRQQQRQRKAQSFFYVLSHVQFLQDEFLFG